MLLIVTPPLKSATVEAARERLFALRDDVLVDPETGCLWIPLPLSLETASVDLVEELQRQVLEIDRQARGRT